MHFKSSSGVKSFGTAYLFSQIHLTGVGVAKTNMIVLGGQKCKDHTGTQPMICDLIAICVWCVVRIILTPAENHRPSAF